MQGWVRGRRAHWVESLTDVWVSNLPAGLGSGRVLLWGTWYRNILQTENNLWVQLSIPEHPQGAARLQRTKLLQGQYPTAGNTSGAGREQGGDMWHWRGDTWNWNPCQPCCCTHPALALLVPGCSCPHSNPNHGITVRLERTFKIITSNLCLRISMPTKPHLECYIHSFVTPPQPLPMFSHSSSE